MPKLTFLNFVGKSVPKDRMRKMCELMELTKKETRLILERFCDNKTIDQCDFIPPDQQRTILPDLNRKVRAWIQHNTGFFVLEELEGMALYNLIKDKELERVKLERKYEGYTLKPS